MAPLAAAAVLLLVAERMRALRFRGAAAWRAGTATDLAHLATALAIGAAAVAGARAASAALGTWTGLPARWNGVASAVRVLVALVALDLGNYVTHWLLHRVDALWMLHEVHHSSPHLDWLATFRAHVLEHALRRVLAPLVLVVAGVPVATIAAASALFLGWAMLNHANLRLPLDWLEGVLITPRLHRLHHVPATTERNLGTLLSCWDRLRGTLVIADTPDDVRFGFPRQPASYPQRWPGQLLAPWRGRLSARVRGRAGARAAS
jgi:sterol desaturase/sphingolipid hydroxylase (fatty acid hydroxylase superfamily)